MKTCSKCGTALTPDALVCPACGEARPPDLKHRLMAEAALAGMDELPPDVRHDKPVPPHLEEVHSKPGPSLAESMARIEAKQQQERESIQQHQQAMASHSLAPADQHLFASAGPAVEPFPLHLKPAIIGLLLWLLLSLLLRPGSSSAPGLARVIIACIPLYAGLYCLFWASLGEFIYDLGWFLWALLPKDSMYTRTARHQREGNFLGFLKAMAMLAGSYGGTVAVYHHYYGTMPMFQH